MALLLNANDSVNRSYTITKPSPNHPLDVNGVGVRTENLFDDETASGYYNDSGTLVQDSTASHSTTYIPVNGTTYTVSGLWYSAVLMANFAVYEWDSNKNWLRRSNRQFPPSSNKITFTIGTDTAYITLQVQTIHGNIMLNTGSEALPYEPYGYKIPISSGGVTTNIYLGSTQTVRWIRKLVLDGTENWNEGASAFGYRFITPITSAMRSDTTIGVRSMCTHQELTSTGNTYNALGAYTITGSSELIMTLDGNTRLASWKSWLAAQYANGTPVTVLYVLTTPETTTVNEPLMKIGDYTDTLGNATAIPTTEGANSITVDTTVQPSEFTATWTGWHNAMVKEWDGSQWNE